MGREGRRLLWEGREGGPCRNGENEAPMGTEGTKSIWERREGGSYRNGENEAPVGMAGTKPLWERQERSPNRNGYPYLFFPPLLLFDFPSLSLSSYGRPRLPFIPTHRGAPPPPTTHAGITDKAEDAHTRLGGAKGRGEGAWGGGGGGRHSIDVGGGMCSLTRS